MSSKPDANIYGGVAKEMRKSRAKNSVNIETNLPQVVMSTLFYELMVAYHSTEGVHNRPWMNDLYEESSNHLALYIDSKSRSNPEELHHVYEWNLIGVPRGRLFSTKKNNTSSGFKMTYNFKQSRRVVPIHPALQVPGPTGKRVTKSTVFKRKAWVMEQGQRVVIRPIRARYLAIPVGRFHGKALNDSIRFNRTGVTVEYPGGFRAKGGFERKFKGYFASGYATRHLKQTGLLDEPARRAKRAGESVPAIARVGFKQMPSKAALEGAAIEAVKNGN